MIAEPPFLPLPLLLIGTVIRFGDGATIPIGLVIESNRQTEISAVTYAVQFANANILTADTLSLSVYTSDPNSTVDTIQKTCNLISAGSVAQIGPATSSHVGAVAPYLEQFKIPLMAPVATSPLLSSFNYTMHLVPSDKEQGRAIAAIMSKMVWKRAHILSSDDEYGLFGLMSFIEIGSSKGWHIASMQSFQSTAVAPNISAQLEVIKHSGFRVTILNCLDWQAKYVLSEAKNRKMTGQGWLWLVTDGSTNTGNFLPSLPVSDYMQGIIGTGFPTVSGSLAAQFQTAWAGLDPVVYPGAGTSTITGGLLDTFLFSNDGSVTQIEWQSCHSNLNMPNLSGVVLYGPPTSVARWADAVFAVAYAIRDYGGAVILPIGLTCFGGSTHPFGPTLLTEIQKVAQPGVAQNIAFTATYPTDVKYEVFNSRSTGWTKVATWDPTAFYQVVGTEAISLPGNLPATPDFISGINGKHFMIVTVFEEPFWFYNTPPKNMSDMKMGTELIGYGVDMTLEVARILNFTFTMYMVPDGNWGGKNVTSGVWNGMVGELVTKRADFAFATFTISNVRESDMDFSTPYIDIGLRATIPKGSVASSAWEFVLPFHSNVWYGIVITTLAVGLVITFLEKSSPYGYHGEFIQTCHDMDHIQPFRRNRKLFRRQRAKALTAMRSDNSVWFSMASLIQQGYELQPRALSSRLVAMLWWFGVMAIISMYTAQLGAVLISSKMQGQINTVAELYAQDRIQYGCNSGTSIQQFFCDNQLSLYKNMCLQMRKWNSFTAGTAPAIARLADPNDAFAYITDSPVIDSITEKQPCNLRKLGEVFNKGGFGVGLQKDSPYNEIISQTILQLRENAFMDKIYDTWFTKRTECAAENLAESASESGKKGYNDLKGVFIVLVLSAMISPFLVLVEFIYSCFEYQKKMSEGLGRMRRDFYVYVIPESWKENMGLSEHTRKRQHELWMMQSKEHRAAQLEVDRMEYQDHFKEFAMKHPNLAMQRVLYN